MNKETTHKVVAIEADGPESGIKKFEELLNDGYVIVSETITKSIILYRLKKQPSATKQVPVNKEKEPVCDKNKGEQNREDKSEHDENPLSKIERLIKFDLDRFNYGPGGRVKKEAGGIAEDEDLFDILLLKINKKNGSIANFEKLFNELSDELDIEIKKMLDKK